MGNNKSKSSTSQTITNDTINQNVLNNLNKTMMNSSYNSLFSNASNCSNTVAQSNTCKIGDINSPNGPVVIGGNQSNDAKVTFSCVVDSKAQNDMSTSMINDLVQEMKSINGTAAAGALNSAAAAAQNTGSLSTATSSASSNTNSNITNNVTNETITNIENIFEQNINNNFTSETVSQCIGRTDQSNTIETGNINTNNAGGVKVNCVQTNSVEVISECKLLSDAINKSLEETVNAIGLKVVTESQTTSESEATGKTTSESTTTGVIQDTGTAVSSVIDSVGGVFSSMFAAFSSPYISSICFIVFIVIGIVLFVANGGMESMGIESSGSTNPFGSFGSLTPGKSTTGSSNPMSGGGSYIYSMSDLVPTDLSITSMSFSI